MTHKAETRHYLTGTMPKRGPEQTPVDGSELQKRPKTDAHMRDDISNGFVSFSSTRASPKQSVHTTQLGELFSGRLADDPRRNDFDLNFRRYMSNFQVPDNDIRGINIDRYVYPTVEHHFHSQKYSFNYVKAMSKDADQEDVRLSFTKMGMYGRYENADIKLMGGRAAMLARGFKLVRKQRNKQGHIICNDLDESRNPIRIRAFRDWDEDKTWHMMQAVAYRYEQDPKFRNILQVLHANKIQLLHTPYRSETFWAGKWDPHTKTVS